MAKYKFQKYVKFRQSYDGVKVAKAYVYLSNLFQKYLGKADHVVIQYDVDNQAICVLPAKEGVDGAYKMSGSNNPYSGKSVGVKLTEKGMRKGTYLFQEEIETADGKGFVCVLTK